MATLAERIKSLRLEKHITQQQLADIAQIDRVTTSRYERGNADDATIGTLRRMRNYFNVSIEYLVGDTNIRDRTVNATTLDKIFDILNDERRVQLVTYAKYLQSEQEQT